MRTPTFLSLIVAITALSASVDSRAIPHPPPPTATPPPPHALSSTAPAPTSTRPPVPSSSAAPITPINPPSLQLNLTWPYSVAPLDTLAIRLVDGTYYSTITSSATGDVQSVYQRSVDSVQSALQAYVGDDEWKHQQKLLNKHMKYVNRHYSAPQAPQCSSSANGTSCAVPARGYDNGDRSGHHGGGGGGGSKALSKFYLRHAQCGACTQHNAFAINPSTPQSSSPFASYEPVAMMKWCTLAAPRLSSELPPSVSGAPLADWEGVCIPAEQQCPSATVDMQILSPSTCAVDDAASKLSCSLCVLDGYHWTASHKAFKHGGDNYAGQCFAQPTQYGSSGSKHAGVVVSTLDGCPSVVSSADYMSAYRSLAASFGAFVLFTSLLLCCLCVRACCVARKARQLNATRGAVLTSVTVPVAVRVSGVPTVSSSPSPSAPPAAGYPAAGAGSGVSVARSEYSQPLLSSSGLNPPRFTVSAYPQVQAYRV